MSLIREIRSGLLGLDFSKKSLLKFALVMAGFFLVLCIANLLWGDVKNYSLYFICISLFFLLSGFVFPKALKPVYYMWMAISFFMGYFMSRIILTLVFYIAITPIALVLRLIKKDILDQRVNHDKSSYWKKREKNRDGLEGLERQF